MNIVWPNNLIEELAYRRCILFLGSGISATSKNDAGESPKTWEAFLNDIISLIPNPATEEMNFINRMLSQKNYLLALQAIYDKCDPGNYANYLRSVYSRPNYKASIIHEYIKEIDAKIVITTNFDKIYENLCNEHGYSVSTYMESKKILSNIKSTQNLIIKAHGTIDDIDNIVFTQKQYYNARKTYPEFYDLLHALFLTNTVLFLGYSLNDPDINLLLESVANSSTPSVPHYIVVKEGVENEIKKFWKDSYNICCLEYGPNYVNLEENIKSLRDDVISYRTSKRIP